MVDFHLTTSSLFATSRTLKSDIPFAVRQGKLAVAGRCRCCRILARKTAMVLKIIGLAIAFFFTRILELLTYCMRKGYWKKKVVWQAKNDIKLLPEEKQKAIEKDISETCAKKNIETYQIAGIKGVSIKDLCASSYTLSYQYYGPVVLDWAKSVLDTAVVKNRKLVFLARDGVAPYKVAQMLQKQYPEKYGNVHMCYVYFSRKLVDNALKTPGRLARYLGQQGIQEKDRCLFVDIGFAGSMIGKIRKQLAPLDLNIKFQYLISHHDQVRGFMADTKTVIPAVNYASATNAAVLWLEHSHQEGAISATQLLETKEGVPYPNTCPPEQKKPLSCKQERPVEYLLKKYSLKGVLDYAADELQQKNSDALNHEKPQAWRMASGSLRKVFNDFLKEIRCGSRTLYFEDPDK